ncbi:MAG: uroporphyrinogen-III C-methyltransferase [Burkholderiales bacterium]|nr:uroporphyrinogen-III C-methyltransferase [Burkholderiales bacterium]
MSTPATVYLVGAGPGAVDLLTVRAARLLAQADIVFHDALVRAETIALATRAKKVAVGKRCGRHSAAQHFINHRLVAAAGKYRMVVRLKGGDPMVFGRSQEEIDALTAAGIAVEVVPGVTAALAAAAQLRVSLTRRGASRSLTLATPRSGAGSAERDWSAALAPDGTSAIYMGAGEASRVRQTLLARGYDAHTPVAICESVSLPDARTLRGRLADLDELAVALSGGPALILVGRVFAAASTATDTTPAAEYAARAPQHAALAQ